MSPKTIGVIPIKQQSSPETGSVEAHVLRISARSNSQFRHQTFSLFYRSSVRASSAGQLVQVKTVLVGVSNCNLIRV